MFGNKISWNCVTKRKIIILSSPLSDTILYYDWACNKTYSIFGIEDGHCFGIKDCIRVCIFVSEIPPKAQKVNPSKTWCTNLFSRFKNSTKNLEGKFIKKLTHHFFLVENCFKNSTKSREGESIKNV